MTAYLSYVVHDGKSMPVVSVQKMDNKAHADAVGLALQDLLVEASKNRPTLFYHWCVTAEDGDKTSCVVGSTGR